MKNNNSNSAFHLDQFEKIEDIIFLDEPILSHYKRNNKNFLFYLVDTTDEVDKILVIEVEEEDIFKYLTKEVSLRTLITVNQNISYLIEQDFEEKIVSSSLIDIKTIDEGFLPEEDSFLAFEPTEASFYFEFIRKYKSQAYLQNLRKEAFYLKLSPTSSKYSETIGFNELVTDLLSNISTSYRSFLKADFYSKFKEIQTDTNKLNSAFRSLSPELDLRMVDVNFGSFEIGLAVDRVMKNSIENKEFKNWAVDVGYKYKTLVLDEDYDEATVETILASYDVEDRKKIFGPIFKITESKNYNLQIKDSKKSTYSIIKVQNQAAIRKIIPEKAFVKEEPKELEIIQVVAVKEKNKAQKSIKLENNLFQSITDNTVVEIGKEQFSKYGYNFPTNQKIPATLRTEGDSIILTAKYQGEEFRSRTTGKIEDGLKQLIDRIYEYIINHQD